MIRPKFVLFLAAALLSLPVAVAQDNGQELLDKATQTKLSAETMGDLGQVIDLCRQALAAGLDEPGKKFANNLLAGTLAQRAELVCTELFERPLPPNRAPRLIQMALADLEETLKIDPEQGQSQYFIGRLYAQLGENEKALKALDNAVRLMNDEPMTKSKALMVRAGLRNDPNQRQADIDEAVRLQPQDAEALKFRGVHHLTQGNFTSAIADFRAAVELQPNDAGAHEALGLAQAGADQVDDADASFTKAIELAPNSASAYMQRGRVRAVKGNSKAAIEDIDQALKLQPNSVAGRLLRAQLLGGAGKFDEALEDMAVLMKAMPNNPEVYLQLAMLCQASKQHERALAAYERALDIEPNSSAAYRGRADVYLSMGEQGKAIADYEASLKVDPKNSGALNNLAWVLATSPEEKLRDGKRSIELATKACEETDYKAAHIVSTLAAAYAETGDFDTAIKWAQKCVDMSTDQMKVHAKKELESYQAGKPWREAAPPEDDPATEKLEESSEGAVGATRGN